jgi:hypothetical protein
MKTLMFIIDLPFRFLFAFLGVTFRGWIGWLGLVLIGLRFFHVISWPWWVAALPLEYLLLYCLYMIIDGALYRAGLKGIGRYARFTASDEELARAETEETLRKTNTPEEKQRLMDFLKVERLEIFKRVNQKLPEQLRREAEINRAIAEQINYATASSQFEGDDSEMRRKLKALSDQLLQNGANEAANEIVKAVNSRSYFVGLAEDIAR